MKSIVVQSARPLAPAIIDFGKLWQRSHAATALASVLPEIWPSEPAHRLGSHPPSQPEYERAR